MCVFKDFHERKCLVGISSGMVLTRLQAETILWCLYLCMSERQKSKQQCVTHNLNKPYLFGGNTTTKLS